ncbi:phosphate ABC transporter substrate-binding protein PstS [Synechococcus sp. Tobar12-5m-g]|uniref:phosphate ABC transporter substrate-binding protein PstS n=1 Tax=unclassified Synechococcus TaxID=2626047 RepID=UPI0020CDA050|nr:MULTISPECIES: phosphate ABC transporter substrate-binding protein PstS [unclassified Synechococcus]MCP9773305.1 phosphate ABC transporter substrate-binding protein PstS [Synechococcus sp. Tobar12-5m-g]MCP9874929.1 phosphate ABC transporter substrate-binding protein PstS [Synechococcus sp. Cruz CV-v-12]
MTFAKKASIFSVLAILGTGATVSAQSALNGAGASFPAPFYQRAFADLAAAGGPKVNYQSVGSGAGVRQFIAGTVDFGATDEPISSADAAKVSRGVVQFPSVGGTIAVGFNNPGCTLKLTQKQLADIFLGEIKDWKQVGCKPGKITVAHRSDGSGTTFAFTSSLSAFSPAWKSKVGAGKSVNWPVGVGGKGNEGVAGVIQNTPGSIGYVNQAFVKGSVKAAALQNKAGKFVLPNLKSGAAALNNIKLDGMLAGEDFNPAGAESYPISTLTWILAYRKGNGAKAGDIRKAMSHLLSPAAQGKADDLGYVPLRGSILNSSKKAVANIGS